MAVQEPTLRYGAILRMEADNHADEVLTFARDPLGAITNRLALFKRRLQGVEANSNGYN